MFYLKRECFSDLTWCANSRDIESENETEWVKRSELRLSGLKEVGLICDSPQSLFCCVADVHNCMWAPHPNGRSVIPRLKWGDAVLRMQQCDRAAWWNNFYMWLSHVYAVCYPLHSFMTILVGLKICTCTANVEINGRLCDDKVNQKHVMTSFFNFHNHHALY